MLTLPPQPNELPVILRRDLVAHGYTDAEIAAFVRGSELEHLSRGVLCEPVRGETRWEVAHNRYLRRVIGRALGVPSGVISHVSAGAWRGLSISTVAMADVHMTRPGRGGSRKDSHLVVHAGILQPSEIVRVQGLRVTAPARTLVDVARTVPMVDAVAMIDQALRENLLTAGDLATSMRSALRRPGMAAARRAIARADGRSESVGETHLRLSMSDLALPIPELQFDVYSVDGQFLGRVDAGYPELAVLIEFDGREKYHRFRRPGENIADMVAREKRREEAFAEAGYVVIRIVWSDLYEPRELLRRIERAIGRGKRNVAAGNVTGRCELRSPMTVEV